MKRATAAASTRGSSTRSEVSSNASVCSEVTDEAGDDAVPMEASMTCVSVVEEGSQIAFVCYNEESNAIILEESYANGHDTEEVVERFLAVARPNLILVGNKIVANAALLYVLTRPPPLHEQGENPASGIGRRTEQASQQERTTPYRLLKSSAFDVRRCRTLILEKLRVLSLIRRDQASHARHAGDTTRERRFPGASWSSEQVFGASSYHSLASIIDFDSSVQVRALGALISFLQSTIFRLEDGETVTVNTINQAKTALFMRINSAALRALHIFATEHHPLMAKGNGHTKEGFSLFSLLDRTKSKVGRQRLKEWMLKPLLDRSEISRRQDGVELFLRTDFQTSVGVLLNWLEKIGAVDRIIVRMQKCSASPQDFLVLSRTLSAALAIANLLTNELVPKLATLASTCQLQQGDEVKDQLAVLAGYHVFIENIVQKCCVSVLRDLQERIMSIVDEAETMQARDTVVIQTGFHEELDVAKETFDNLDKRLSTVGTQIVETHPSLKQLKVLFYPQLGFLIALDKRQHGYNEETNDFVGLPQDFKCVFIQNNDAFFKSIDMAQLDEELGDLDAFIKDMESMIVSELEDDILDCETDLRATFGALADLDCILSFASCAADLDFVRPNVVDASEKKIVIANGRHPLQELIIDTAFIPNDTHVDARCRVNVITGPNFSGKSCYTRQVGILVYMAHIGSFLPCDGATISITDQILARINTIETCAVPQSSFQLDLTQMGTILRRSTPYSLVLIDEFGKGTNPASGIAVLVAALKKLSMIECRTICTTHFLEIFSLGLLRNDVGGIHVLRMAVHIPDSNEDENAAPLFKLEKGVASSSAGLVCARAAGVNKRVVNRAKEIIAALRDGGQVPPDREVLRAGSLTRSSKEAIRMFVGKDSWNTASEDDIGDLLQKITEM